MAEEEGRKLTELRVIDLRAELERRKLDRSGNKQTLLERLHKVLIDNGDDPGTYLFQDYCELSSCSLGNDSNENMDDSSKEAVVCDVVADVSGKEDTDSADKDVLEDVVQDNDDLDDFDLIMSPLSYQNYREQNRELNSENTAGPKIKASTPSNLEQKDNKPTISADDRHLWITNISKNTRATDLKQLLSKHGKVIGAKVVINARLPNSCCYGYVKMESVLDANNCIEKLSNTNLSGSIIKIEKLRSDYWSVSKKLAPLNSEPKILNKKPSSNETATKPVDNQVTQDTKETKISDENGDIVGSTPNEIETKEKFSSKSNSMNRRPRHKVDSRRSPESKRMKRSTRSREKPITSKKCSPLKRSSPPKRQVNERSELDRERDRLRERERVLRDRQREDQARQRELQRQQRDELERLENERDKLKREREVFERQRTEFMKIERERQKLEREKLELERLEYQRARQHNLINTANRRISIEDDRKRIYRKITPPRRFGSPPIKKSRDFNLTLKRSPDRSVTNRDRYEKARNDRATSSKVASKSEPLKLSTNSHTTRSITADSRNTSSFKKNDAPATRDRNRNDDSRLFRGSEKEDMNRRQGINSVTYTSSGIDSRYERRTGSDNWSNIDNALNTRSQLTPNDSWGNGTKEAWRRDPPMGLSDRWSNVNDVNRGYPLTHYAAIQCPAPPIINDYVSNSFDSYKRNVGFMRKY